MSSIVATQPTVGEAAGVGRRNLVLAAMVFAGGDDVHRSDDRGDRESRRCSGIWGSRRRGRSGSSMLPACAGILVRVRRQAGDMLGRRRMSWSAWRGSRSRRRVAGSRQRVPSRKPGSLVSGAAGRGRGADFPGRGWIVAAVFPQGERGRAMAVFFGISGGLTAIGPIAGGYLTQWTWRSISGSTCRCDHRVAVDMALQARGGEAPDAT